MNLHPKDRTLNRHVTLLKALGHPSRLWIVQTLLQGEQCVCDLKDGLNQDMSTVSRHLSVLRNAGLVHTEKRGLYVYYSLRCPNLPDVLSSLAALKASPRTGI